MEFLPSLTRILMIRERAVTEPGTNAANSGMKVGTAQLVRLMPAGSRISSCSILDLRGGPTTGLYLKRSIPSGVGGAVS
jgi:hypothetical protein